jgi:hypothetical protein
MFSKYIRSDSGAVTVDWTVLSAAAVAMAMASATVMTDAIGMLTSRVEAQMRTQQLSDTFVAYSGADFEAAFEAGVLTDAQAQQLFATANGMMNQEIVDSLELGITAINNGTPMTQQEFAALLALASVAKQRNIIDDAVLDHYFGI